MSFGRDIAWATGRLGFSPILVGFALCFLAGFAAGRWLPMLFDHLSITWK